METISRSLNSDIDTLEEQLNNPDQYPDESMFETINTLHKIWPSKKAQIEVEVRKTLTELGLEP